MHGQLQAAASAPWPPAAWDPAAQPPSLLIGIVSSDVRLAVRALRDCACALDVPFQMPSSRVKLTVLSSTIGRLSVRHAHTHLRPMHSFCWQVANVDNITAIKGACYIKYMAASAERSYCSSYSGQDRGILLQLGQQQVWPAVCIEFYSIHAVLNVHNLRPACTLTRLVIVQVGHLPLGLFEPQ